MMQIRFLALGLAISFCCLLPRRCHAGTTWLADAFRPNYVVVDIGADLEAIRLSEKGTALVRRSLLVDDTPTTQDCRWIAGVLTPLGAPGLGSDINNKDTVVGSYTDPAMALEINHRGRIWPLNQPAADVQQPDIDSVYYNGHKSLGFSTNNDKDEAMGTYLGVADGWDFDLWDGFLWQSGQFTRLGDVWYDSTGGLHGKAVFPAQMNNHGAYIGQVTLFAFGTSETFGCIQGEPVAAWPRGINDALEIVGYREEGGVAKATHSSGAQLGKGVAEAVSNSSPAQIAGYLNNRGRVWRAGPKSGRYFAADLNLLIPRASRKEWSVTMCVDINKSGVILAYADKYTLSQTGERVGTPSNHAVILLPVEVAPDVLRVNSNFDEGRIDPETGYAIPDCDDMDIALEAQRAHLDGKYTQYQRITDDLHSGWFGVNPQLLPKEFWDGGTVTIRKVDKVDDDTGHPESGQVRFYAKWGEAAFQYCAIIPYNLETLAPTNLVQGGINKKPGEGVYGSSSTIPQNAKFYMEGVRPGKITLEWRFQKNGMDVRHEQAFLVETRWTPEQWKRDLAYKIRLDSSNDPSGQVDVFVNPRGAQKEYWSTVERMSEYYDYYRENYLKDDDFQWSGMARLAGSQVIAGISDARYSLLTPSVPLDRIVGELIDALRNGGFDIFDSLAWQHHAYRSSGIGALKWIDEKNNTLDLNAVLSAWIDYDKGKNDSDAALIAQAAKKFTQHEQNRVIVRTWAELSRIRLENGNVADMFTILAENVMKPNGDRFTVAVPGGNLGSTADRWKWIDNSPGASPNGIIGAWTSAGKAGQRPLVSNTIFENGKRFSIVFQLLGSPLFVRDHQDVP